MGSMFGHWNANTARTSNQSPRMGQIWGRTQWGNFPRRAVGVCPPGQEIIRTNPIVCAPKVVTRLPGGGITAIG